jgi:hypothetical protein
LLRRVVWWKFTGVSQMLAASIIRVMSKPRADYSSAASTSETSVNFHQTTRRNIPEDSHLYTHRHENLKFRINDLSLYFTPHREMFQIKVAFLNEACILCHSTSLLGCTMSPFSDKQ